MECRARSQKIELLDRFWPQHKVEDPILIYTQGDITDEAVVQYALNAKPHVIFHLAAIVSGEAEKTSISVCRSICSPICDY